MAMLYRAAAGIGYNATVTESALRELLEQVAAGTLSCADATKALARPPIEQIPAAMIDHHRALRCGHPEVIFCPGKTATDVVAIAQRLRTAGQHVLATRADETQRRAMKAAFPQAMINDVARAVLVDPPPPPPSSEWPVCVICAGTADLPVAEEAALTLRSLAVPITRLSDVGVSGIHRLLNHVDVLREACAVIVIAGMEGALPSVVGGLVACPVFAVPTSVGYGANFSGVAALLAMLNSCASNVSVLNIDNGFGAAFCAGAVYRQVQRGKERP